jgi:ABC-type amino acid transport substrate-binding protein
MKTFFRILLLSLLWTLFPYAADTNSTTQPLLVGTKIAPPFAMKDKEGHWEGISIELWDLIAQRLHLTYTLQEHTLKTLLDSTADAKLDVAIAAITITGERENRFDFSHSYYTTGLSIAIPKNSTEGWWAVLRGIFTLKMFLLIFLLGVILFFIGTVTWLVERGRNPENFHPSPIKGIASGIWWAAVTMTTVGYGDMTPKTLGGRLIALFWMFGSLLLVSSIIAGVASTLTVAKMDYLIAKPEDLARGRIASIQHSVSDRYLHERRIYPEYYASVPEGLQALKDGKVDAMVYDAPLLQYIIKEKYAEDLAMVETLFESQNYGIAFPEGSALREKVNREMLGIIHSMEWEKIVVKYLGKQ